MAVWWYDLDTGQRQQASYHPRRRMYHIIILVLGWSGWALGFAAENELLNSVHEDLRAANEARSQQGIEVAAWRTEGEALSVTIESVQTEMKRAQQELATATNERDRLSLEHQRLGAGDVAAAHKILADAAVTLRGKLQAAALTLPPGGMVVPADDSCEAALKAIDLSQRALGQISVAIVAGHAQTDPATVRTAVRLLRAGSLAWWMAIEGPAAGTAAMVDGQLQLFPTADAEVAEQIRHAIAIAEGRADGHASAEPVVLPRGSGGIR